MNLASECLKTLQSAPKRSGKADLCGANAEASVQSTQQNPKRMLVAYVASTVALIPPVLLAESAGFSFADYASVDPDDNVTQFATASDETLKRALLLRNLLCLTRTHARGLHPT